MAIDIEALQQRASAVGPVARDEVQPAPANLKVITVDADEAHIAQVCENWLRFQILKQCKSL